MINLEFDLEKFNVEVGVLCDRGVDYLDAVIHWCHLNNVELEVIAKIIKKDSNNKNKLSEFAEVHNLFSI